MISCSLFEEIEGASFPVYYKNIYLCQKQIPDEH